MRYFEQIEFDSPDELGSGVKMDKNFLTLLELARGVADIPFRITSGYRTVKHNKFIGGKRDSSHLRGLAADISVADSRSRSIILNALISVGFNRIGIGKTFIHVDKDVNKSRNVYWLYY
jgi:uncharacterized protein YcbK (DUF882 family)